MPLNSKGKNAKCPQISDEIFFLPLWTITFDPLSKDIYQRSKKKFPSEILGHFAFTFCRYFKSEYEGIYLLQVLSIRIWGHLPSAGTFNQNLRVFTFWGYLQRAMTVYFWDEVFSLKKCLYMPSNNNSVQLLLALLTFLSHQENYGTWQNGQNEALCTGTVLTGSLVWLLYYFASIAFTKRFFQKSSREKVKCTLKSKP
jgi:hypothetical protein